MHKFLHKSLLITIFVLLGFTLAHSQSINDETTNIDFSKIKNQEIVRAFENAKAYQKTVLLIFEASWCQYCKKLREETMLDEKVIETLSNFERLNVDVDENPEDAAFFDGNPSSRGGGGIPAIIVFTYEGKELGRVKGFHEAKPLNDFLKKQLKKVEAASLLLNRRPKLAAANKSNFFAILTD